MEVTHPTCTERKALEAETAAAQVETAEAEVRVEPAPALGEMEVLLGACGFAFVRVLVSLRRSFLSVVLGGRRKGCLGLTRT